MQIDASVGKRIKEARVKAGFTQKQLAEKCGLSTGTIQQYELGKRYPKTVEIVEKIADILNTTSLFIMWGIADDPVYAEFKPFGKADKQQPSTVAAHFSGDEYTPEELEEIRQFAEFVKSKRPKPSDQDE